MIDSRQEEIERYIHNKMNTSERQIFRQKLKEDKTLLEDVLLQLSVHEAFEDTSILVDQKLHNNSLVQEIQSELQSEELKNTSQFIRESMQEFTAQNKKGKRRFLYQTIASIAAIFLIGFSIFKFIATPNSNLYDTYADWDNGLPSLIEKGSNPKKLIVEIETLYNRQDYDLLITKASNSEDPYILIYKGISYVKIGNTKSAMETFDRLIQTNTLESSRGYWYKLLLSLQANNIEESKQYLSIILQDKANYNYDKASIISKALKNKKK